MPCCGRVKTILLVEDDLDFGETIAEGIEDMLPYRVLVAASGLEALRLVRTHPPDLFLLDYRLPGMDGLELYTHLHATRGLEQVSVLFLTAYPFTLGLKGKSPRLTSLEKPIDFSKLLWCIDEMLADR